MDLMQKEGVIKGYKTIIEPESAPNGIVPDTFSGSGSTMMACEQTNRVCCTMELDEKYAPVILRRSVENGINPDDIFVERDGKKLMYAELVKEVETK
ncbi:MAG: DNA methyltransferase [Eubacteriales bacterium]|nr:DNA methyltransferase [Eubacteriales bacterium]